MRSIGVVGAGVMGAGIAQTAAVAGFPVTCVDVDDSALAAARDAVVDGRFGLRRAVEHGRLRPDELVAAVERLHFAGDLAELAEADIVVEAVPEDLALKVRLFRQLDAAVKPGAVLATNSSGLPVAALAAATDRPERVLGWHWSSPAPVMRFAEVVVTPQTDGAVVESVVSAAWAMGKHPVVVRDAPMAWGYVANRVYFAAVAEARRVVAEGVASEDDVDTLLVDCFRWPVGPFAMLRGATEGWS